MSDPPIAEDAASRRRQAAATRRMMPSRRTALSPPRRRGPGTQALALDGAGAFPGCRVSTAMRIATSRPLRDTIRSDLKPIAPAPRPCLFIPQDRCASNSGPMKKSRSAIAWRNAAARRGGADGFNVDALHPVAAFRMTVCAAGRIQRRQHRRVIAAASDSVRRRPIAHRRRRTDRPEMAAPPHPTAGDARRCVQREPRPILRRSRVLAQ